MACWQKIMTDIASGEFPADEGVGRGQAELWCLEISGSDPIKVNVIEGKKYWVLRKDRMILLCVLL